MSASAVQLRKMRPTTVVIDSDWPTVTPHPASVRAALVGVMPHSAVVHAMKALVIRDNQTPSI